MAAVVFAPGLKTALAGFALIGFGTAVLFPLMITAAARIPGRPASDNVASVILLTGVFMMAAPAAMGWIAEVGGLRAAYAATIPFFVTTLLLIGPALRRPQAVAAASA
jgi:hypothetical protein